MTQFTEMTHMQDFKELTIKAKDLSLTSETFWKLKRTQEALPTAQGFS